jgi:hypothetical protein
MSKMWVELMKIFHLAHPKLFAQKKQQLNEKVAEYVVHFDNQRRKNNSICMCNYFFFWCHKPLQKNRRITTIAFKGFGPVYLQRLHALINL